MFKVSTIFDQFIPYILRGKNMGSFEKYGNNLRFFCISISHKARMHGFCVVGHFLQSPKL